MARARPSPVDKLIKPGRIRAVLTTLGREIAQDLIPVGTTLPPEPELEARFGVGRGVVREAIKTLAAKGLVSVRPRHGTQVLPRHEWSLLDRDVLSWLVGQDEPDRGLLLAIQEVRSIIEPAAAALAAERATKNDRWRIDTALAAMQTAKDQASALAADKAFHLAILDATHNPVLQGFRGAIDTILSTVFTVAVVSPGCQRSNDLQQAPSMRLRRFLIQAHLARPPSRLQHPIGDSSTRVPTPSAKTRFDPRSGAMRNGDTAKRDTTRTPPHDAPRRRTAGTEYAAHIGTYALPAGLADSRTCCRLCVPDWARPAGPADHKRIKA